MPPKALTGVLLFVDVQAQSQLLRAMDLSGRLLDRFREPIEPGDVVVSPDQSRLALMEFVRTSQQTGTWEVFVRNLDGSGVRRVSTPNEANPPSNDQVAWSPDGQAVSFRRQNNDLVHVEVETGNEVVLARNTDARFAWARRSRRIAYTLREDGRAAVEVLDVDSGRRQLVGDPTVEQGSPAWSSDDAFLSYVVARRDAQSRAPLHVVEHASGEWRAVLADVDGLMAPVWSPQAPVIVAQERTGLRSLLAVNADATGLMRLTLPVDVRYLEAEWSPGGDAVAFVRDVPEGEPVDCCGRGPQQHYARELGLVRGDGSEERLLTERAKQRPIRVRWLAR